MTAAGAVDREERVLRQALVDACRWLNGSGLSQGTSGNISLRHGEVMLISPSGVPYAQLRPEDVVAMTLMGTYGSYQAAGGNVPSSEWRFHLDIMRARPEVGAVVHAHSTYATVLAICRKAIPACHYMIAAAGGPSIRCADYATYGTKELSAHILRGLEGRTCCLLANHGMLATGPDLAKAQWLAVELETLARQYYLSLGIGGPVLLSEAEIERVKERFKSYGPRPKAGDGEA